MIRSPSDPFSVAIAGSAFFQVTEPSGDTVYTRTGNLSINSNGALVLGSATNGRLLEPAITIPPEATEIAITPEGQVMVRLPGQTTLAEQGQLQLANFTNPQGLLKLGENLFQETGASGTPVAGNPGDNGLGFLQGGALEASNVEPVQELIDLITTQRSFELNSQAVQAGDQILQLILNLRRS